MGRSVFPLTLFLSFARPLALLRRKNPAWDDAVINNAGRIAGRARLRRRARSLSHSQRQFVLKQLVQVVRIFTQVKNSARQPRALSPRMNKSLARSIILFTFPGRRRVTERLQFPDCTRLVE